jgi:deoxyribose-phosphate aldolase
LSPDFREKDIIEACNTAKKYKAANVNVNSCWAELTKMSCAEGVTRRFMNAAKGEK